ncbi:MAG: CHASE2 domain-containing protein, partial [Leptolyngbyaceae cyanobacterium]
FIHFAKSLAQHKDVHECLLDACQELKTNTTLTYPAADLVPSLFRYPNSDLFRIPKTGWRDRAARLSLKRIEAIALMILLLLCWQRPVQKWLIERRVLVQAMYRDLPFRRPQPRQPPIYLVQIDEAALRTQKRFRPIPRDYLAQLVDQVAGTPVIGIDYLLDLPDVDTPRLAQSIEAAARQGSHFVLGASREQNTRQWRYAEDALTDPNWTVSGSMTVRGTLYAESLWSEPLPLSFLLASLHQRCIVEAQRCALQQIPHTLTDLDPHASRAQVSLMTRFSYRLGQMWLHPIIDYSLPPDWIYTPISSQELLGKEPAALGSLVQTVFIVPNYAVAGIDQENEDNFVAPAAYRYWHRSSQQTSKRIITGGEYHAYLFYQYLSDRFVIPIPDVWMILVAAIVGKGLVVCLPDVSPRRWRLILAGGTCVYAVLSLELYVSALAFSAPIVTPAIAFWLVVWPHVSSRRIPASIIQ